MYYIYGRVWAIPTYRVYRLYDRKRYGVQTGYYYYSRYPATLPLIQMTPKYMGIAND